MAAAADPDAPMVSVSQTSDATVSVPETTETVACTAALPASGSAMLRPVPWSVSVVCSVAE